MIILLFAPHCDITPPPPPIEAVGLTELFCW